eukprot:TRINITY_DN9656_c0_g1_i1.p1 TRINITY_DN9656_c0_g1~~TRINITY_DN9656_c0_g1_i1.p1  ORF type:complete len:228 (-),score=65.14 TRINITY_DN9656_c0_g1_i1:293-976(-)
MPMDMRWQCLTEFNTGVYDILIATDAAADEKSQKKANKQATKAKAAAALNLEAEVENEAAGDFGVGRGLDFREVENVLNFVMPKTAEQYTHRVGRTARGGQAGFALSLVSQKEDGVLQKIIEMKATEQKVDVVEEVSKARALLEIPDDLDIGAKILFAKEAVAKITKETECTAVGLAQFAYPVDIANSCRYRVEDTLRTIGRTQIEKAKTDVVRKEVISSEKMKIHF